MRTQQFTSSDLQNPQYCVDCRVHHPASVLALYQGRCPGCHHDHMSKPFVAASPGSRTQVQKPNPNRWLTTVVCLVAAPLLTYFCFGYFRSWDANQQTKYGVGKPRSDTYSEEANGPTPNPNDIFIGYSRILGGEELTVGIKNNGLVPLSEVYADIEVFNMLTKTVVETRENVCIFKKEDNGGDAIPPGAYFQHPDPLYRKISPPLSKKNAPGVVMNIKATKAVR